MTLFRVLKEHIGEHPNIVRLQEYGNGQGEVCDLGRHTHRWARLGHELSTAAAAISPDGRILATGADDARVKPWDIDHDKLSRVCGLLH